MFGFQSLEETIQFLIFYLNTSHLQRKASLQFRKGQELAHWFPPTAAWPPLLSLLIASTLFSRKDKREEAVAHSSFSIQALPRQKPCLFPQVQNDLRALMAKVEKWLHYRSEAQR